MAQDVSSPAAVPEFRANIPVEVRFRDLDPMGHVNNAVFFSYFEAARVAYMREVFPEVCTEDTPLTETFPFILAEITCRYVAPIRLCDTPFVGIRVSKLGGKSFEFQYRITDGPSGRLFAEGKSTQVTYDYKKSATRQIPEDFRRTITEFEGLPREP